VTLAMVRLGPAYPPSWAGKPPHMMGRDLGLWARWRQRLPYPYVALYFDVAVSLSSPPAPSPEGPNLEAAWWFLTAKRIDVVGELPHRWDIIELRRGADQARLGPCACTTTYGNRIPPMRSLPI